jgi:hypothetical protein
MGSQAATSKNTNKTDLTVRLAIHTFFFRNLLPLSLQIYD